MPGTSKSVERYQRRAEDMHPLGLLALFPENHAGG
jgi:hypothetical protein